MENSHDRNPSDHTVRPGASGRRRHGSFRTRNRVRAGGVGHAGTFALQRGVSTKRPPLLAMDADGAEKGASAGAVALKLKDLAAYAVKALVVPGGSQLSGIAGLGHAAREEVL